MKSIHQTVNEAFSKYGKEVAREVIEIGVTMMAEDTVLYFQNRAMKEHAECASLMYDVKLEED